jgi:hypothetical protein
MGNTTCLRHRSEDNIKIDIRITDEFLNLVNNRYFPQKDCVPWSYLIAKKIIFVWWFTNTVRVLILYLSVFYES